MRRRSLPFLTLGLAALVALALAAGPAGFADAAKRGGVLASVLIENPPGLLIHESATVSTVWPMSPFYSNLVLFNPAKALESVDTVLKPVAEIQKKLEAEVARPMLGWRKEYFAHWPHVKGLVAHNSLYNYGRTQDVWLDK
jgi:hypothetical protein